MMGKLGQINKSVSPIHNFEEGCPFIRGLDYFAWHAEEWGRAVKRLLAFPAVQFGLTCTVIPGWTDWNGVKQWLGFLSQCSEVRFVVPCVLRGEAGGHTMCWTCNSFINRLSVRRHEPVWTQWSPGWAQNPQRVQCQHFPLLKYTVWYCCGINRTHKGGSLPS